MAAERTAANRAGAVRRTAADRAVEAVPRRSPGGPAPAVAPPARTLAPGRGRSWPPATAGEFGRRLGRDLSGVRVHTDGAAAAAAGSVRAEAYTLGSHIVFAAGAYRPETPPGRRLLAHELAHVLQQPTLPAASTRVPVGDLADPAERAADRIADAALRPGAPVRTGPVGGPPAVRRSPEGNTPQRRLEPLEAIANRIARQALGPAQLRIGAPNGPVLS